MRAAIYARYSSDNQREESIEAQIRACKEYAERNGIEIVKIYTDEAKSATTDDRPAFLQMIRDTQTGLFQAVIVHKLDRFARNRYDSAYYKRILKKHGVRLISVLERLDDSPESVILESVLEGMAEYYSKNLAREVMKGLKENALQCRFNGGLPPLGYDVVDGKYVVNEAEAAIVRKIFSMYANGHSYNEILEELKDFKTKKCKPFGKNSIHDILCNEKYIGVYVYNKGTKKVHRIEKEDVIKVEGGIPAIIDKETWERVQERMRKNKRNAENKAKEVYLLSGLIFCGECGGAMVGNRRYSGKMKRKYLSYECSTKKRKKLCKAKAIGKEYVEDVVIKELEKRILSDEAIEVLAHKIYDYAVEQHKIINADIELLEKELVKVQTEIENIVNAIAAGMFHPSMKAKMDELEAKKVELTRRLNEAKYEAQLTCPSIEMIKAYLKKDAGIKNKSLDEQKRIIQTYVHKVVVYEDRVEIYFIVDNNGSPKTLTSFPLPDKTNIYINKEDLFAQKF